MEVKLGLGCYRFLDFPKKSSTARRAVVLWQSRFQNNQHRQVEAKISDSEYASVDERLKELIEALNTFPDIQTYESCQGYKEYANVYIQGSGIFKFAYKIAQYLDNVVKTNNLSIDSAETQISLSIQYDGIPMIPPYLLLQFPNSLIPQVTHILCHVRIE